MKTVKEILICSNHLKWLSSRTPALDISPQTPLHSTCIFRMVFAWRVF